MEIKPDITWEDLDNFSKKLTPQENSTLKSKSKVTWDDLEKESRKNPSYISQMITGFKEAPLIKALGELVQGKNNKMEVAYNKFKAGQLSHQEYQKIIDEEDQPLFDFGNTVIQALSGAVNNPVVNTVGLGMVSYGLGSAVMQGPEQLGYSIGDMAPGILAYSAGAKIAKILGHNSATIENPKASLNLSIDVDSPVVNNATHAVESGVYTPSQLNIYQKLKTSLSGSPKVTVEVPIDGPIAVNKIQKIISNTDFTDVVTSEHLVNKLGKSLNKKENTNFNKLLNTGLDTELAASILNHPDVQPIIQVNKDNFAQKIFRTYTKSELQKDPSILKEITDIHGKGQLATVSLDTLTEMMDSGNPGKPITNKLYEPTLQAWKRYIDGKDNWMLEITAKGKELLPEDYHKPITALHNLSKNEVLEMAIQMKNPEVLKKMETYGVRGLTVEQTREVLTKLPSMLTENDVKLLDYTRQLIDTKITPEMSKGYLLAKGEPLKTEINYFPISYEKGGGVPIEGVKHIVDSVIGEHFGKREATSMPGSTKVRLKNVPYKLDLDFVGHLQHLVDDAARVAYLAPTAKEVMRVFRNIEPYVTQKYGYSTTQTLLHRLEQTYVKQPTDIGGELLKQIRGKAYPVILIGNIASAARQVGSFFNAVDEVGWSTATKGLLATLDPKAWDPVKTNAVSRTRMMDPAWDEMVNLTKLGEGKFKNTETGITNKIRDIGMLPTGIMDRSFSIGPAFIGPFQEWLKMHPGDIDGATKVAERALIRSQSTSQIPFRPGLHQDSEVIRTATMFFSQQIKAYNRMLEWTNKYANGEINKGELVSHATKLILIPALTDALVSIAVTKQGDRILSSFTDKQETKKLMAQLYSQSLMSNLPYISQLASAIQYGNGMINFSAGMRPLQYGTKPIMELIKKDPNFVKAFVEGLEALSVVKYGIPLGPIKKIVAATIDRIEGVDNRIRRFITTENQIGKQKTLKQEFQGMNKSFKQDNTKLKLDDQSMLRKAVSDIPPLKPTGDEQRYPGYMNGGTPT